MLLDLAGVLALLAVVAEQFEGFGLVSGPAVFFEVAIRPPEGVGDRTATGGTGPRGARSPQARNSGPHVWRGGIKAQWT